jgi:predicted ribonuclease YlaK
MFLTTSFLRGITLDNAVIIVDECQNLTFHELDTIVTSVGQDANIFFCGYFFQTDLMKSSDKQGMVNFMKILDAMQQFDNIEFTIGDIVRSGFVKEYLINKIRLGIE